LYPYRIFVSYSRADSKLVDRLHDHLVELGAHPMFDKHIKFASRFSDEIRNQISYAHIFIAFITNHSKISPWVLQEIGYAMGLRVPILPLAIDHPPTGMAGEINAIMVDPELINLDTILTETDLYEVVKTVQSEATAMFECTESLLARTDKLVKYANRIYDRYCKDYGAAKVRQRMAFSSFSIPNKGVKNNIWDRREGLDRRGPEIRELLLKERKVMEKLARGGGCDLILDPYVRSSSTLSIDDAYSKTELETIKLSSVTRLETLINFLEDMPDDKVRVVFQEGKIEGGMHIIGDWFATEAVVPKYKGGYKQTIFTHHAPTVLSKIEAFDYEFEEILMDMKLEGISSRETAIIALKNMLTDY